MTMLFEDNMIFYFVINLEKNLKVKYNFKRISVWWDIIKIESLSDSICRLVDRNNYHCNRNWLIINIIKE